MRNIIKCLLPAAVLVLGMPVIAAAQDCPSSDDWRDAPAISTATADQRNAVNDLMGRYAWAMNNRDINALKNLFADGGSYVFCQMGKTTPEESYSSKDAIGRHFETVFRPLTDEGMIAKRILVPLMINIKGSEIDIAMSSVVITKSRELPLPQLDYMADIFATVERGALKRLVVTPADGRVSIRAR